MKRSLQAIFPGCLLVLVCSYFTPTVYASSRMVMGKLEFRPMTGIEKAAGVWVDGQYVGYMHELKGKNSVMLLPGEHTVTARQDGYKDFNEQVTVRPGEVTLVSVGMAKAPAIAVPAAAATVKIDVAPNRAAVFVDGLFVGHVREFTGIGRGMLIAPGNHRIKVACPGFQTFETDINPMAYQTVEVKTRLLRSDGPLQAPLVNKESSMNQMPAGTRGQ